MLVDVAHLDTAALAAAVTAGGSSSSSSGANVIVDDFDALWECLRSAAQQRSVQQQHSSDGGSSGAQGLSAAVPRIDVILDNAGWSCTPTCGWQTSWCLLGSVMR